MGPLAPAPERTARVCHPPSLPPPGRRMPRTEGWSRANQGAGSALAPGTERSGSRPGALRIQFPIDVRRAQRAAPSDSVPLRLRGWAVRPPSGRVIRAEQGGHLAARPGAKRRRSAAWRRAGTAQEEQRTREGCLLTDAGFAPSPRSGRSAGALPTLASGSGVRLPGPESGFRVRSPASGSGVRLPVPASASDPPSASGSGVRVRLPPQRRLPYQPPAARASARRLRPRCRRTFTVPRGRPVTAAISW